MFPLDSENDENTEMSPEMWKELGEQADLFPRWLVNLVKWLPWWGPYDRRR